MPFGFKEYQRVPTSAEDAGTSQIDDGKGIPEIVEASVEYIESFWHDFKEFLIKGSSIELGIGVLVGSVFNAVLKSFLNDMIMPPVGALAGNSMKNLFIVLKRGKNYNEGYDTIADATIDGAVTLNYGIFIENVLEFLLASLMLYWIIKIYTTLRRKFEQEMREKMVRERRAICWKCPDCLEAVKAGARRCPHCTAKINERIPF